MFNSENFETKISSLNINGEGVCSVQGKKCCIKGVLPDEVVLVGPVFVKRNFVQGEVVCIKNPSNNRILPPCAYANVCGGCDFMFASPSSAIKYKRAVILDYFKDFYQGELPVFEGKNKFSYRNKVSFMVSGNKIGLQKSCSHDIVEISSCMVAMPKINQVLNLARIYVSKFNTGLNHVVARQVREDVCVVLVSKKMPKNLNYFENLLNNTFGENYSLYINFNQNSKDILSENFKFVSGKKVLTATEFGVKFYVYPHAFLQVNDEVRNLLYSQVLQEVNSQFVVEGYSGVGILSAIMAKRAREVVSIELNKSATQSAEKMKAENNLSNLTNINGDFGTVLPEILAKNDNVTLVVDPPRSGCDKLSLDTILTSLPDKIVYISCNPYTLKQNVGYLKKFYKVQKMALFDIFPQTSNIETLAILKKI